MRTELATDAARVLLDGEPLAAIGVEDFHESQPVLRIRFNTPTASYPVFAMATPSTQPCSYIWQIFHCDRPSLQNVTLYEMTCSPRCTPWYATT